MDKIESKIISVTNYRYTRYKKTYYGVAITSKSIPEEIHFPYMVNKFTMVSEFFDYNFGITENEALSVLVSKCVHGEDRKGAFLTTGWECRFNKRPRRTRPNKDVGNEISRYLNDPGSVYSSDHINKIWLCEKCGYKAYKEGWPWRFVAGLENSDYITHCPKCANEDKNDPFAVLLGRPKNSVVMQFDNDRPEIFPSGNRRPLLCENLPKGRLRLISNDL